MLLLNLMRINGLTPHHSRHGPKRNWNSRAGPCVGAESRLPRRAASCSKPPTNGSSAPSAPAGPSAPPALSALSAPATSPVSPGAAHTRRSFRTAPLSPGQLRHHNTPGHLPGFAMTPPGTPERATLSPVSNMSLHDFWPSVSSVSDNDEVELFSDYNDTLFDMLLNTLSLEGAGLEGEDARPATPPVQPWTPPTVPPTPSHSTHNNHSHHNANSPVPGPSGLNHHSGPSGHNSHSAASSSPPQLMD